MNYVEAMEFSRLLNVDPEVDFAEEYDSALEASLAMQDQLVLESSLDAFVEDMDEEEQFTSATEAFEKVSDWLKKVADWFKRLLMRFQAMVRGIIFKNTQKSIDKTYFQKNKKGELSDKAKAIRDNTITIDNADELNALARQAGIELNGISADGKVDAEQLARITKAVLSIGIKTNTKLQNALRKPESADVKTLNDEAKATGKLINKCTSMLNKAAQKGVIAMKKREQAQKLNKKADDVLS